MKQLNYFLSAYAVIILLGGIMGFVKAQSLASLIMGTSFSLLLLASILGIRKSLSIGFYGAFGLTMVLSTFFAYRFVYTQQFMPSGLMLCLSLLMMARFLYARNTLCKKARNH